MLEIQLKKKSRDAYIVVERLLSNFREDKLLGDKRGKGLIARSNLFLRVGE